MNRENQIPEFLKLRLSSLQRFLNEAKETLHLGVPGVFVRRSDVQGPTVGITVLTHGNEIAGMDAIRRLVQENTLDKLIRGRVIIVVNNLLAAEKFLAMLRMGMPAIEGTLAARKVDLNMNRLPSKLKPSEPKYEVLRALELRAVWRSFEYALDIHSFNAQSPPYIVCPTNHLDKNLLKGLPAEKIITNITKIQGGRPACSFYGQKGKCGAIAFEAGNHYRIDTFENAYEAALQFCRNVGVLPSQAIQRRKYTVHKVVGSIMATHESQILLRSLKEHDFVKKGWLLTRAVKIKKTIPAETALRAGHVLFAPRENQLKPEKVGEEWFFITAKPKPVTL